ncbi:MAG: sugar-transfer associated ATP-grasp domain-containing protein [Thermoplasmata archaeon]
MRSISPWRKHGPFAIFIAALFILSYYLDQQLSLVLPALHSARILIQLALAATVIAILRNVVGIRSFGTFSPVIIALSMIYTGLLLGLLLFAGVMLIMILTRATLHEQRIQRSHRAAIMVLMVAMAATLLAAFATDLGRPEIAFVLLFPVVITAWFADRYLEEVDKVGWGPPTRALLWTLVLVAAAYVVMVQDALVDTVMREPVSWPLLVLLNWFLGTRVKVRLSERLRFGSMKRLEDVMLQGGLSRTVLTINRRNAEYVSQYNPPEVMGSLNKARAKALMLAEGIPVPDNYLLVSRKEDVVEAVEVLLKSDSFALKPADGYGGEGIVVVSGREGDSYITGNSLLKLEDLLDHLGSILEGDYNKGMPDEALVEALVRSHPSLKPIAPEGVPDIRVLCFRGYPVMTMLRLPTRQSDGKANLHMGAVGAGVEVSTGLIRFATWMGELVERHPDTGAKLVGFQVPFWREVLEIACEAQRATGLGFAGVDIVLDAERGPLVLEVNRRPGLDIQKANGCGLLPRLRAVEGLPTLEEPSEVRVLRAMEMDRHGWPAPASLPPGGSIGGPRSIPGGPPVPSFAAGRRPFR